MNEKRQFARLMAVNCGPMNEKRQFARLMAVNCGPTLIMAQGISTHGPIETSFNCS